MKRLGTLSVKVSPKTFFQMAGMAIFAHAKHSAGYYFNFEEFGELKIQKIISEINGEKSANLYLTANFDFLFKPSQTGTQPFRAQAVKS